MQRWGIYEGEFLWAVDMQAIAILLVGPILAAAVAVDTARHSQVGNYHLALLNPRRYRQYWFIVLSPLAVLVPIYLVVLSVLAIWTSTAAGFLSGWPSAILQVTVHVAWMFFFSCAGSLIGRFTSPTLGGVLGIVLGIAVLNAQGALNKDGFGLLDMGGATFTRIGLVNDPVYLSVQILILAGAGVIAVFAPVRVSSQRLVPSIGTGVVAALVLGCLFIRFDHLPDDRWLLEGSPPTDCVSVGVEICTYPEHPKFQEKLIDDYNAIFGSIPQAEYEFLIPDRIVESSHGYSLTPATNDLELSIFHDDQKLPDHIFLARLYSADHCAQRSGDLSVWLDNYFNELDDFTYSLRQISGQYSEEERTPRDQAWLRGFIERYKSCGFDAQNDTAREAEAGS